MAKARERGRVRLVGVTGRRRSDLLISTALQATTLLVLAAPAGAQPAPNARPLGGSVMAGAASISQSPGATTIDQTSQRAAINWQSFNVGSAQTVTFAQPSSSAAVLNRVIGPDPSQIAGKINANGQVVLVNQAGATFYKGAQVNAQSFIVSTANVSTQNFMAGKLTFDQAGSANAGVSNQGTITVKQAGLAALVAPNVANSGVINARLGHVVLAGAKTATIDLYGDGLLSLDVSNQVTKAPVGAGGKTVTALVTNTGVINADGGTVQLTAAAADGVLQTLIRSGGTVTANSTAGQTGTVTVAGLGGSVTVTGLVSASGQAAGTMGGQVAVNSTNAVTLASTARINASGAAGGGTVAIGTTLQRATGGPGTTATMTAANVTVRKSANISASATKTGNGGRVVVLSTVKTVMNGSIAAMGGSQSGNGGFVEVSGGNLTLAPTIDVSAPHGTPGTILLDPTNLDIVATEANPGSGVDGEFITSNGTSTLPFGAADGNPLPSEVLASTLASLGANSNLVVQASGNIDVKAAVTVNNGLTMQAGGNLTIEAGAPVQAGGSVLLQAGTSNPAGALTINDSITVFTDGPGTITLISGTGGIALNGNIFTNDVVDLSSTGGGVIQAGNVGITAQLLQSSNGVAGDVRLLGTNAVAGLGGFAVTPSGTMAGNFQLIDTAAAITVGGTVSSAAGNVYLQSSDTDGIFIASGGAVTTGPDGLASFRADAFAVAGPGFTPTTGTVIAGTFELAPFSPGQTVTLGQSFNGGLVLPSFANINAGLFRIGAVTPPGATLPVTQAAAIAFSGTTASFQPGPFDVGNRALELDASGTIDGTAGAMVNVSTLSGSGGDWGLISANSISNLGAITGTNFDLNDTIPLTVAGPVNGGASAVIADTGALTINGTVSAAVVALSADSISIPGEVTDGGAGSVILVANTGTISETGTLIAGVLSGSAAGTVNLLGTGPSTNLVAAVGSKGIGGLAVIPGRRFTAASFALRDGAGLTVAGTIAATDPAGKVFLESTAPAGIQIASSGAIIADAAGGTVSLQTDLLANNAGVVANTIELAPATAGGIVTLGAAGTGLSLLSMAGLATTNLVIGAVTQPNAGAPTTTAGAIVIGGAFAFGTAGVLTLDAASTTGAGASGAVTQTAALTGVQVLSGTADSFTLTNPGNGINDLVGMTATTGDLIVVTTAQLFPNNVASPAGNVFLSSSNAGGVIMLGPLTAGGRVSIEADALGSDGGSVTAATFELAPFTAGNSVTLGANTGLSLFSLNGITAGTVRIGAVTLPGGVAPTITAGAVTIAGPFNAAATTVLELDASSKTAGGASGAITQTAPLLQVGTLAATGDSVTLTNPNNQIVASSGLAATNGNVELVDSTGLGLDGAYSGNNLFIEVAAADATLTVGVNGAATLTGARISLVADSIFANAAGSIGNAGGTVELAPFSATAVTLVGVTEGNSISGALLDSIDVGAGTLLIGGFTNPLTAATTPAATAASLIVGGNVDLTGRAATLVLLATGSITEPTGSLIVGTVTGVAGGDFLLSSATNQIQASTGMTSTTGSVVLVDDPTLLLTGPYNGANLFFQVTRAGGSLALGDAITPATLTAATGGRVSLVADSMTATATSTITAPVGTVELAPFSAIDESVAGTNGSGQLLVDATLLSDIAGGGNALNTLVIGGYTALVATGNVAPGGTAPLISASGVTLDGALNLTSQTANLQLLSNGSVTEPGGPLTVTNVSGSSVGLFSLASPANAIGQSLGITASNGDVVLVDGASFALVGNQSGNNLFFEVASAGGTLQLGTLRVKASLTAATGGRITLVADQITANGGSTMTVPSGTLELAPFSAINTSLLGTPSATQLTIGPALLSIVTPGISTLVVGGFTNEPAGAAASAPSAASVTIDGAVTLAPIATTLDLEATGAVSQAAPIVNVGTLLGLTGSTVLNNAANTVAVLGNYVATNGFALTDATNLLIAGQVTAGPAASFTVNGALTETGGITANMLNGGATGNANLTGTNTVEELDSFAVSGSQSRFALNDNGNLLINGSLSAMRITVSDPSSRISLGDGSSIVTGGSTRPSGLTAPASLLPQNGAAGAFFKSASFAQIGRTTVSGLGGGPSSLQISVTGNMQFDPPLGLSATGTWLTLNLTNGTAAGNIFVQALDVSYSQPGAANLAGSINGTSGPIAASLGFIQPAPDPRFLFNNCEIGIANCTAVSLSQQALLTETAMFVPLDALLALVTPALVLDPGDKDDLLQLPVVSREDY